MLARALRARRDRTSVLLAYHGISHARPEHDPDNLCVAPERFRRQLGLLLEAGFEPVTVSTLLDRWSPSATAPPPGMVALTFDDGMEDNLEVLLPILREHGATATVYVTTGHIGRPNPFMAPEARRRMLTAEELRELAAAGVELGGHTVTHPDLSRLDEAGCRQEVEGSLRALEAITGTRPRTFAYPFGHYGPAALRAVRASRLDAALTAHGRGGWLPHELHRTMVTGIDGTAAFAVKVAGHYEALHGSRAGLAARAATRSARQRMRSARSRA